MPEFQINIRANAQQFGQVISNTVSRLNSTLLGTVQSRFAGLFAGGALAASAKSVIDYASQFNDSAQKLGVGVEFLQEAAFAAKQTGATLSDVELGLKRLQVGIFEALRGKPGNDAQEAFQRLGVSLDDLRSKSPEQIFRQIAEHVQRAGQSSQALSDMIKLMGRSADTLLPAFLQGFSDLAKEAYRLGLVLDQVTLKKLDDMGDRLDVIRGKWKIFMAETLIGADNTVGFFEKIFFRIANWSARFAALKAGLPPKIALGIGESVEQEFWDRIVEENRPKTKPSSTAPFPEMPKTAPTRSTPLTPIGQDQFARMGLYVTGASAGLAQSQIGLLRAANIKLDAIKSAIDTNTTATRQILD